MKERPIIFSGPMVRAILEGRKTQTRRILKPQRDVVSGDGVRAFSRGLPPGTFAYRDTPSGGTKYGECPYGVPGDRLWVRETHFAFGHWEEIPGAKTKSGRTKWRFIFDSDEVLFNAPPEYRNGRHHKDPATPAWHKRSSQFLFRCHARLTLEIVSVRVERLQAISEEDAIAEGLVPGGHGVGHAPHIYENDIDDSDHDPTMQGATYFLWVEGYKRLWESIHGPGSWEANSWVWVLEFEQIEEGN